MWNEILSLKYKQLVYLSEPEELTDDDMAHWSSLLWLISVDTKQHLPITVIKKYIKEKYTQSILK